MKNIKLKYWINDQVTIIELERPGVVVGAIMDRTGLRYDVRYFWDGNAKFCYFYDWELKAK